MTRSAPGRIFAGYFVGILLVQLAWIITVPAFRGSDEFDHVYKAVSVTRGQWTAPDPAPNGRGGIVTVPGDIVRAASRVCDWYDYTGHDNCHPIKSVGHGDVQVATAAGAYNPAYYVVVGNLARPFLGTGVGADYAMRAITAVICALLVAWAAALIARWADTAWPLLAFSCGLTPVLVYSTAVAAPNGVTFASAALVWSALIGLARARTDTRELALPLVVGSTALVSSHTTGAMWLALTFAVVLMLQPFREWVAVLRPRWRTWATVAVIIGAATLLCSAWIRHAHTNTLGTEVLEEGPFPWERVPVFQLLWILQAVGAFPMRNDPAPIPVYVLWGLPLALVIIALFRLSRTRERVAAGATLALLVIVPTVLTAISWRAESVGWQGRYSLPLWLGITAIAGLALDRRPTGPRRSTGRILFGLLTVAMTISTVYVGMHEVAKGPTDPAAAGFFGGFVLVGLLTAAGSLVPLAAIERRSSEHAQRPERAGAERALT